MSQWCRVYGVSKVPPDPAKLVKYVRRRGLGIAGQFMGDKKEGWCRAELLFAPDAAPMHLERNVAIEPGSGARFKTWVNWLEQSDADPDEEQLMELLTDSEQIFTLDTPDDYPDTELMMRFCIIICQFLARETRGIYQVDGEGLFRPDGTLLRPDG